MHDHVHALREHFGPELSKLRKKDWWEFETYLVYWLAALFVLVEGFNKLKLRDARVQALLKEPVGHLKELRHETYHFAAEQSPGGTKIIAQLNWAEDLHEALGAHIAEVIDEMAKIERSRKRKKKKKSAGR
jgi:hypothetical protein